MLIPRRMLELTLACVVVLAGYSAVAVERSGGRGADAANGSSVMDQTSVVSPTTRGQARVEISASSRAAHSDAVRICQVGYLPVESKIAVISIATSATEAIVRESDTDAAVLHVAISEPKQEPDSGDTLRSIDFSALTLPGKYYIELPGVGASYDFIISADAFTKPFRLAMRMFTGQRCGCRVDLAPDFPEYHYPACHGGEALFDASSGNQGSRSCIGGWHDAGDYGRYVVNSGITTATLLWAYELNETKLRKLRLDLPDSSLSLPDMLTEIKWNLRWMLSMQDDDGGVWPKATSVHFAAFVMPQDDALPPRIVGTGEPPYRTTAATADFAAVCAVAARVYRPFDPALAGRCLAAAQRAWRWCQTNPSALFTKNPSGISTGGYGDRNVNDELLWMAAELFRTTGDAEYNSYFVAHYSSWEPLIAGDAPQGWADVRNMAMYAYAMSGRENADRRAVEEIRAAAIQAADEIAARSRVHGYRIALTPRQYFWGSNGAIANYAMMVLLANRFQTKPEYANCAQDALHYLFGRNTFNTSFVTQVGSKWPMHPHHRPSTADGVTQPWPGMLVGGPNASGGKLPPARQWVDDVASFTTNEIAINWNAPLVFVLAEALP